VIEHSTFKNIAAFLNSEGGTLLLGVNDEGALIVGLDETDFTTFSGKNKRDEFLKHFDNLVQEYFGNDFTRKFNVDFVEVEGKTICAIEIKERAAKPVALT
jgi:predicted HTH transcriptional regulator